MEMADKLRRLVPGALAAVAVAAPAHAVPTYAYTPITPTLTDRTVVLNGHDLTIEDVIAVARHGAKVRCAPQALARGPDTPFGVLAYRFMKDTPARTFMGPAAPMPATAPLPVAQ